MTLNEFRPVLLSKSVARVELPSDSDLKERIFTALKFLAKKTVPLRLHIVDPVGFTILRRLDDGMYIRMPSAPISEESEIDMDLALIDALALYVMAGLERVNAKVHMGMCYDEIDMNNERLTETFLEVSTNDSKKFCVFP